MPLGSDPIPFAQYPPVYLAPVPHPGLLIVGNLDVIHRGMVHNKDGSVSTVHSVSWTVPIKYKGKSRQLQVLMPTTYNGQNNTARAALNHFLSTKQHLGVFDTIPHANAYAVALHNWLAAIGRQAGLIGG